MEEDIYAHLYAKRQRHNKRRREYNVYKIIIAVAIIIIAIAAIVIYMSNKNLENEKQNAERLKKEAINAENKEKEKEKEEQNKANENKDNQTTNTGESNQQTDPNQQATINKDIKKYPVKKADAESKIVDIYSKKEKVAYLTFDDGPSSNITPKVLDVLKEEGVKATFFVLGQNVKSHPEQLKRIYDEGHYIANHSYTHKYSKIYASVDALLEEFNDTEAEIKKVVGEGYNTFLFRFPGGSYGGVYNKIKKQIKGILRDKGIVSLDWNALSGDAEGKKTVDAQLKKFEDSRKGETGLVVLMHDIGDKHATPETARQIIKRLKAEGYVFKNFYEIFQ